MDNVTQLLDALRCGDASARQRLFPLVYDELRALAGHLQRNPNHTVQPTALVHEAFMRMVGADSRPHDRRHFFNVAATAMRQVLVDHARRQQARKRDAVRERLSVHGNLADDDAGTSLDLLDFEEALQQLERTDPRQARVVELRFIVGLSIAEVAQILEVSPRTVNVDWKMAQAWLKRTIADDP